MRAKAIWSSFGLLAAAVMAAKACAGDAVAPPTVELPGRVQANAQADLYATVAGYVQLIQVDIGDHVKKGDVLAKLSVPDLEAEVTKAKAHVEQAKAQDLQARAAVEVAQAGLDAVKARLAQSEADLKRAKAQSEYQKKGLQRLQELLRSMAIDQRLVDEKQSQVDAADAEVAASEAAVAAARAGVSKAAAAVQSAQADAAAAEAFVQAEEAEVKAADVAVQFATLKAPFDGIVSQRSVDVGSFVRPPAGGKETPLFVVMRVDSVRVVVNVPERDAVRIGIGAPAVVRIDALTGQEFKGKVTRIAGAIDPSAGTLRAEIDLPNTDAKLMPGMFGNVTITPADVKGSAPVRAPEQSGLIPALPPGTSAPIVLPFDPTGVGVVVRGADAGPAVEKAAAKDSTPEPSAKVLIIIVVDRQKAAAAGLSAADAITQGAAALHSNFWIDPATGKQYFVGVQSQDGR